MARLAVRHLGWASRARSLAEKVPDRRRTCASTRCPVGSGGLMWREERAEEACHEEAGSSPGCAGRGGSAGAVRLRWRWLRIDVAPSSSPTATWSAGVVPTAEQLASVLVTDGDYEGTWTVNVPPDAQMGASGVVTEEQQAMLPRIELCDKASEESRAAAEALRWQAFRQLDQSEDDPHRHGHRRSGGPHDLRPGVPHVRGPGRDRGDVHRAARWHAGLPGGDPGRRGGSGHDRADGHPRCGRRPLRRSDQRSARPAVARTGCCTTPWCARARS